MRFQFLLFFIFTNIIFSQNELYLSNIDTLKKDKEKKIVAIDKLGNEYSINENEISKNDNLFFSDFSLGNISSIDLYNPLKIKVWYGNYNTLIILDNFLNEMKMRNIGLGVHYQAIPEHPVYKKLFKWKISDFPIMTVCTQGTAPSRLLGFACPQVAFTILHTCRHS